jgi:hypothetical protein
MQTTTKAEYLENLKGRLASVQQDLYLMPVAKLGSEWHVDRCDEARWLSAELERLS